MGKVDCIRQFNLPISSNTVNYNSFNSIVEQVVEKLRVLQSASMPDHILRENIEALKHDYMRQLNTLDQE